MNKKNLIGSIIAVAIIVLASFSSVVGKVSLNEELVELDVEICGLGKKYTVQLTQQEADEVEQLFDDIEQQLSLVETREEAEEIFKEAVVELDKYGLLGGLSVRQAQKLIVGNNFRNKYFEKSDKIYENFIGDNNTNYFCLIAGKTTATHFFNIPIQLISFINWISMGAIGMLYSMLYILFMVFVPPIQPLKLFTSISFGGYHEFMLEWIYYHSEGEIWTLGINGIKEWNGSFNGGFFPVSFEIVSIDSYDVGVKGFCGLQITVNGVSRFIGYANRVKIV